MPAAVSPNYYMRGRPRRASPTKREDDHGIDSFGYSDSFADWCGTIMALQQELGLLAQRRYWYYSLDCADSFVTRQNLKLRQPNQGTNRCNACYVSRCSPYCQLCLSWAKHQVLSRRTLVHSLERPGWERLPTATTVRTKRSRFRRT